PGFRRPERGRMPRPGEARPLRELSRRRSPCALGSRWPLHSLATPPDEGNAEDCKKEQEQKNGRAPCRRHGGRYGEPSPQSPPGGLPLGDPLLDRPVPGTERRRGLGQLAELRSIRDELVPQPAAGGTRF